MLIRVKYADNRFDYVKNNILDVMINAEKITEFRRNSGWVRIGLDPVRKNRREFTYT